MTETNVGEGETEPSTCTITVKKVEGYSELTAKILEKI